MRKIYLSVCVCVFYFVSNGQVQFVTAGTFPGGSPGVNIGTFKSDGSAALLHDFKITDPTDCNSLLLGPGGKLYGTTTAGGTNYNGVIFSVNQDGTNFKVIYNYRRTVTSRSRPAISPNGKLYAVISDSLFNIAMDSSSATFITSIAPNANGLVFDNEGWVYGLANRQQNQIDVRFVFRIKEDGSQYTVIHEFDPAIEGYLDVSNTLICITPTQRIFLTVGGSGYPKTGFLVSMRKDGSDFKIVKSFTNADEATYGLYPNTYGSVTHYNGKIIFTTVSGGSGNNGTILSYDTLLSRLTIIFSFPNFAGSTLAEANPQVINGKLFGVALDGLYNVNLNGTNYQKLNKIPLVAGFILDTSSGKIFYCSNGGKYKKKYLVEIDVPNNTNTDIHSFSNLPDGYNPGGVIKATNGLLYGITKNGGAAGGGTLFKMNIDGSGFKTIKDFSGNDGQSPFGQLFNGSDGKIYGICRKSGIDGLSDSMLLFGIKTDGTNYSVLHLFDNQITGTVVPELTEGAGGQLFGILSLPDQFPPSPSIFRINKDGSGYSILKTLSQTGSDGINSNHGPIYYNGYLYGVCTNFGNSASSNGSIFRISENGTDFSVIKYFTIDGADGATPEGGLTLASDKKLYGITTNYGANYLGTIFSINPEDRSFKLIDNLNGNDGISPESKFLAASDGKLYLNMSRGILQTTTESINRRLIPKTEFNLYTDSAYKTYFSEIPTPVTTQLCPATASTILKAGITGTTYQWQLNSGNGFENISSNANYSGTNSDSLQLINIPSSWTGYEYRCLADYGTSNIYKIKFANNWTGSVNSAWENTANWSCGSIPDANTDVVISSGTIVLSSNATVRSLKINPSVNFTVNTGFVLTVTH